MDENTQQSFTNPTLLKLAEEPVNGFHSTLLAEKFQHLGLDKWSIYLDKITEDFKTAERRLQKGGVCLEAQAHVRRVRLSSDLYGLCDFREHSEADHCKMCWSLPDCLKRKLSPQEEEEFSSIDRNTVSLERLEWLKWTKMDGKFRILLLANRRAYFPSDDPENPSYKNWFWSSKPILECSVEEKIAAFPKLAVLLDNVFSLISPAVAQIELDKHRNNVEVPF